MCTGMHACLNYITYIPKYAHTLYDEHGQYMMKQTNPNGVSCGSEILGLCKHAKVHMFPFEPFSHRGKTSFVERAMKPTPILEAKIKCFLKFIQIERPTSTIQYITLAIGTVTCSHRQKRELSVLHQQRWIDDGRLRMTIEISKFQSNIQTPIIQSNRGQICRRGSRELQVRQMAEISCHEECCQGKGHNQPTSFV